MTQCPKCNRTYAEDFAFCLEDGTPLKPSAAQQPTLVNPSPGTQPPTLIMTSPEVPPPPTVVMPTPETQTPVQSPETGPAKAAPTVQPSVPPASRPGTHATSAPAGPATVPPVRPPTTPPSSSAITHAPVPTTSGRPLVGIVIGVLAVVLLVVVVGAVGVLLLNQSQTQNQNSSPPSQASTSTPSTAAANPNPGSTVIPLSDLSPNSSASPSTAGDVSAEGIVVPGTYQCELTRKMGEGNKVSVALKIVLAVNMNGTYLSRGYMTIPQANIHDQLGIEERGNYSQSGDTMILTNRKERQYDLDTGRWKGWATPDDGAESHEKVRNVTPNTFQLFDDQEKEWFTFTKT